MEFEMEIARVFNGLYDQCDAVAKEIDLHTVAFDNDRRIATVFYDHHTWLVSNTTIEDRPWDDLYTADKDSCIFTADATLGSIAKLRNMCEAAPAIWQSDLYKICVNKVRDYLNFLQDTD